MAINRLKIDGYGQLELNNVAFRRDGRIEAQCFLDPTDFKTVPAENGMLLAVDNVKRVIKFVKDDTLPIALNYTTEHMYDERANGLKDFKLERGSFLPRMGYLAYGDKYTTNCICYDTNDFNNEEALLTALKADLSTSPLYAKAGEKGATQIVKNKPEDTSVVLKVIQFTTMPDGQPGVKFQVVKA